MGIKLWDVAWRTQTAGPSPFNNYRTEYFLKGCKRALSGNPCEGCFNSELWDDSAQYTYSPSFIVENAKKQKYGRYITIGGGEPTDQLPYLIELCRLFKESNFHVLVYTWKPLEQFYSQLKDFIVNTDIVIDGSYMKSKRLYEDFKGDGFLNSVGSGNQIIWDTSSIKKLGYLYGYRAQDLDSIYLTLEDELKFVTKENAIKKIIWQTGGKIDDKNP